MWVFVLVSKQMCCCTSVVIIPMKLERNRYKDVLIQLTSENNVWFAFFSQSFGAFALFLFSRFSSNSAIYSFSCINKSISLLFNLKNRSFNTWDWIQQTSTAHTEKASKETETTSDKKCTYRACICRILINISISVFGIEHK